jgi:DNA-binding XRE family transcriptional regulator
MLITAAQLRAARGLLDWTRTDLAKAAGISPETVKNIEHGTFRPQEQTADAIVRCFREQHVEFINDGVRIFDEPISVLDGDSPYLQLLERAYALMKGNPGEILFMFADNRISPPEVVEAQLKLRDAGCTFRFIVEEGNDFYRYPKNEYRKIAKEFFNNDVVMVFSGHVGILINKGKQALFIHNASLSDTIGKFFDFVWHNAKEVKGLK